MTKEDRIEGLRVHVDEGGSLSHANGLELLGYVETLLKEGAALAANQCHAGYSDEGGSHRCRETTHMLEALTPSAATKAAYIGEFKFDVDGRDDYDNECMVTVTVPWTTTKEIMAAIKSRATRSTRRHAGPT